MKYKYRGTSVVSNILIKIHNHRFTKVLLLIRSVWDDTVRRKIQQPLLSSIVKVGRLSVFGMNDRMNKMADASRVLFEQLPESWKRPPGMAIFRRDTLR